MESIAVFKVILFDSIFGQIIKLAIIIIGSFVVLKYFKDKMTITLIIVFLLGVFCFHGILSYILLNINLKGTTIGLLVSSCVPAFYGGFIVKRYGWLSGLIINLPLIVVVLWAMIVRYLNADVFKQLMVLLIILVMSVIFGYLGNLASKAIEKKNI